MDYSKEFKNYAIKHMGVSSLDFHYWEKLQDKLYGVNSSMTPYVLEEREMRYTQIDIFSRMMMDRIIWLAGPVNDSMSTVVQAQLMFLDNLDNKDITLHIDSPGGSVKSGLSIVDVIDYVSSDIITVNTGMAASMGSVLLGAGTVGKRSSLPHAKVMIHQSSGGAEGHIMDAEITWEEWKKTNQILFELLGSYCGKTAEQVIKDANRDMWLTAEEAVNYGIIDNVIKNKVKGKKK